MLKLENYKTVRKLDENFWIEDEIQGQYSDINNNEENDIIEQLKQENWLEVVEKRFSEKNPWLYSIITDRGRNLFLDFVPLKKDGKYLDVGSGWGQIAIPLSRHGHVYCLDLTLSRLKILREIARQEKCKLMYLCGNYITFPFENNQFDLVILNGTLEWINLGISSNSIWQIQIEALKKTFNILSPGGYVYIGIENALGLKYLFGAPDDHTSIPYLVFLIEEKAKLAYKNKFPNKTLPAKTWSLNEYKEMFANTGLDIVEIYGCFPDYKLIRGMIPLQDINSLIAENGLPYPEHSGIDGTILPTNELLDAVYHLLARNNIAEYFCPSYGIVARKPL